MQSSQSLENAAVLACLNVRTPTDSLRTLLGPTLNWEQIANGSAQLGIAPFVYSQLQHRQLQDSIPPSSWKFLEETFVKSHAQNVWKFVRVREVLQKCHERDIPVIVLKGAALAQLVYPRVGCRPMGDIDILLKRSDLTKVETLLNQMHFEPFSYQHTRKWYEDHHHHLIPYRSPDKSLVIELHHHIIPLDDPVQFSIQGLWDRAVPFEFENIPCFTLAPEDLLIHLCHHVAAPNYFLGQLRSLCDIAETITYYEGHIDWEQLYERIVAFEVQCHAYYALWLANDCVGAAIPQDVLNRLKDSSNVTFLSDRAFKYLIRRAVVISNPGQHLWYLWILRDLCFDWLSQQKRWRILKNIWRRLYTRMVRYAEQFEERTNPNAKSSRVCMFACYLTHLIKKGFSREAKA